jgi:flagellar hook-basal body complex protein FliE
MDSPTLGPIGVGPTLDYYSQARPSPDFEGDGPFARVINKFLGESSAKQAAADQAIVDLATGKTENIHEVMLAVTKADLTFRTILQVRNRVIEAYQEITRMSV